MEEDWNNKVHGSNIQPNSVKTITFSNSKDIITPQLLDNQTKLSLISFDCIETSNTSASACFLSNTHKRKIRNQQKNNNQQNSKKRNKKLKINI